MNRTATAVASLVMGLVIVLGRVGPARADDQTTIRIATLDIGPFVPVAYAAKLADKFGFKAKVISFRRGLDAARALAAGAADVGVGGVEAGVSAVAGGAQSVIVAGGVTGGIGWVARKGSGIHSIKDLKGHKFAVIEGLHELVMRLVFEKYGLSYSTEPGKDVQVVYINSSPGLITALRTGSVDAASAPEPFPSRAVLDGFATPLPPPYDTPLGRIPRAIFMRRAFLQQHRVVAQRFIEAYVAAMKVFRDEPAKGRDFALNDVLKGHMTKQDWALSVKNEGFDVSLDTPEVQRFVDDMLRFGMIHKKLNAADFTDFSMLNEAKAKLHW